MFGGYYQDKRVLITGHTGFKGSWLSLWLQHLGAQVWGYAWPPPTNPNFHELIRDTVYQGEWNEDIRDLTALTSALRKVDPHLVFHLAAQPLVPLSYKEPLETLTVNAIGTAHLLEAVRQTELPANIVVITSDKCYENQGWEYGYREHDPLGGHDVYSMSKAVAELIVQSWRRSFFQPNERLGKVATARAGNVIGGGDYARDRLIPDCVRALIEERPIPVRNPASTRPWQHVLDCLSGYLWLGSSLASADKQSALVGSFNFGPGARANRPVAELVKEILDIWPGQWRHHVSDHPPHEAARLNLAIDKAAELLAWFPTWDLTQSVRQTIAWYRERHLLKNPDMVAFSRRQIESFHQDARARNLAWSQP